VFTSTEYGNNGCVELIDWKKWNPGELILSEIFGLQWVINNHGPHTKCCSLWTSVICHL